ncbi:hypothetical protein SIID45300_02118 [Candidatus Magnetaquicoccaceae bacterium FCR-1]|uniref:Glycosyltransferase RgtA/B/C/D-like domain-containing protein n=2 Tax=Candidatus Magnetaquiglobus chichijimensis TaxID=3141448 RepID=A0ABQ0CA71_9PROT
MMVWGNSMSFAQPWIRFDHPISIRETIAEDRRFVLLVMLAATVLYFIVSIGWPIGIGRDGYRYFLYYFDLFLSGNQQQGLWITPPGISIIVGLVARGGIVSIQLFLLTIYLVSILGIYYIGRLFGRNLARVVTLFALLHFQYTLFCHFLTSDPVLALFLTIWGVVLVRLHQVRTPTAYAVIGFVSFLPVLIRPMSQLYLFVFVLPVLCFGFSRRNFLLAGATLSAFAAGLLLLASYHALVFHDFGLFKGGKHAIPFRNIYMFSRIIAPENGPASQRLINLIEEKLLSNPLYRDNGITLEKFLSTPKPIFFHDIIDNFGNEDFIFDVSMEAIRAQPARFWQSVYKNIHYQFSRPFDLPPPPKPATGGQSQPQGDNPDTKNCQYAECAPIPTNVARERRDQAHSKLSQEDRRHHEEAKQYVDTVDNLFSKEPGNHAVAEFFRSLNYKYPPIRDFCYAAILLLLGIHRREVRLLWLMIIPHFMASAISGSMVDPLASYRIPHDLFFILAGLTGVTLLIDRFMQLIRHGRARLQPSVPTG